MNQSSAFCVCVSVSICVFVANNELEAMRRGGGENPKQNACVLNWSLLNKNKF